jgi:hypothetical protein
MIQDSVQCLTRVLGRGLVFGAIAAAMSLGVSRALADDFLDRINQPWQAIPENRRTEVVLLPLLAKMDRPPAGIATVDRARLIQAGMQGWSEAAAWATAKPQADLIKVLGDISKEMSFTKSHAYAQPYGEAGIPPAIIAAELYTMLGDPPTLAAAQHKYLPAFDTLAVLVNIEATRLAAEGRVNDSIDLLTNFLVFARQLCDRSFFAEAKWGLSNLALTHERIRDIAYRDMMGERKLDMTRLLTQIGRLLEGKDRVLDLDRMPFPHGNQAAVEQIIARVYTPRAGVKEDIFPSTMARLGSTDRPLRLFGEAARWKDAASSQANWFDAESKARGIFADWESRWRLEWFNNRSNQPTEWARTDLAKFATISQATPMMDDLRGLRQAARVEATGTRQTLALIGMTRTAGSLPRTISAVRPRWLTAIEADPFNPNLAAGNIPPLRYFVPMRDTPKGEREEARPFEMSVIPYEGGTAIGVRLKDDVFVLYSLGSDANDDFARRIQNGTVGVRGADYLLFPPVLSLYRQNLIDRGDLK